MNIQTIQVTYYVLFIVTFPDGIEGEETRIAGYFSDEDEAKKVADLKRGCYGSKGTVIRKELQDISYIHVIYETAQEWANNVLTVNESKKVNF